MNNLQEIYERLFNSFGPVARGRSQVVVIFD